VLEAREGQQGNPEGAGRTETEEKRQKVGREPVRDRRMDKHHFPGQQHGWRPPADRSVSLD